MSVSGVVGRCRGGRCKVCLPPRSIAWSRCVTTLRDHAINGGQANQPFDALPRLAALQEGVYIIGMTAGLP